MRALIKFVLILSLVLGLNSFAQKKPEKKPKPPAAPKNDMLKGMQNDKSPVQIQAQSMEILRPQSKVLFTGNVVLKKSTTIIKCVKLTAYYDEKTKDLNKGICEGNVRINMKDTFGTCKKGTFDNANQLITMDGSPVIYQKDQIIRGQQLKYYMIQDRVTGSNVTIIRNPGGKHP